MISTIAGAVHAAVIAMALPATAQAAPPPVVGAATVPPPPVPDRNAAFVRASAAIPDLPGWSADLLVDDSAAYIRFRGPGEERVMRLGQIIAVLSLLADRRVEGLWPAIDAWAGPGLTGLRDRNIDAARSAMMSNGTMIANNLAASTVRPRVRAAMLMAEQLTAAGQWNEASAILLRLRGTAPGSKTWEQLEWSVLTVRLASYVLRRDGVDAAVAFLETGAAQLGPAVPYTINIDMTRAAMLVEGGRYAQALAVIEPAAADFRQRARKEKKGNEKVPGSDRHFAWITACALHGLGRDAEATAAAAALSGIAEPTDRDFVMSANGEIRYRYAWCTRDVALATDELVTDFDQRMAGGALLIALQPARRGGTPPDAAFAAQLRDAPGLKKAAGTRFRVLPTEYDGALNGWRAATD